MKKNCQRRTQKNIHSNTKIYGKATVTHAPENCIKYTSNTSHHERNCVNSIQNSVQRYCSIFLDYNELYKKNETCDNLQIIISRDFKILLPIAQIWENNLFYPEYKMWIELFRLIFFYQNGIDTKFL